MDLIMPVMNGVDATRQIMAKTPCAILVVTATVEGHTGMVFEALGAGALDAVQTPELAATGELGGASAMKLKVETIRQLVARSAERKQPGGLDETPRPNSVLATPLVVIGASAGGPAALAIVLHDLPEDLPAPIVIIQHIDAQFAPSMAAWLNEQCPLTVRVALEGEHVQPGTVLIAASNDHLVFVNSQTLHYTPEPRACHYRPSIDVFFESVVKYWKGDVVAVLLTGMGRDGAKGLKALRAAGASTIAQDAASCVVYGMPKAAAELGAAAQILPLVRIASGVLNSVLSAR
jgi:two-component system response regulator WspF